MQELVTKTVEGLGYDLVEIERSAGGLLRITIDHPWVPGTAKGTELFITVEDCEKVTRQLQFGLEVEGVEYRRLEVSSPGIDRPLRKEADFQRFAGELVDLTLKAPLGAAAAGQVAPTRKKFRGRLERVEAVNADTPADAQAAAPAQWQLLWSEEPPAPKPGQKPSRKKTELPVHVLGFTLDELRDARLAPVVNFKGRGNSAAAEE
ncbi:ribosome maturation factor RimP [Pseudorhodoferax soli]|uniref:Ribosome maturation factor RimP n=1 Tax=Pseudorhodoferax soli TaxID=545864 RepID=A0A368XWI5_9BURK|nr:ribosome maturation factor RimP [Pseudorhodoferax soli]